MLMGKLVSRNKYELYEYVTAVLISLGMVLFMFGSNDAAVGECAVLVYYKYEPYEYVTAVLISLGILDVYDIRQNIFGFMSFNFI